MLTESERAAMTAPVSLLALLDAPFALPDRGLLSQAEQAGQFITDAAAGLGWDHPTGRPDPATSTAAEQLDWLARRMSDGGPGTAGQEHPGAVANEAADGLDAQLWRRFGVFGAHVRMLAGYQPPEHAVLAPTLIVSADSSPNAPARSRWPGALAGPVTTVRVASDHYAFLRPPLAAEVAAAIRKEMRC